MAKTKEISVFDTKAQKVRLLKNEYAKEYIKNTIIYEKIEKGIQKRINTNTMHSSYTTRVKHINYRFKTLQEAKDYRSKNIKTISNYYKSKTVEKSITKCKIKVGTYNYYITVSVDGKAIHRLSDTLEKAKVIRDKLEKQQKLIRRFKKVNTKIKYNNHQNNYEKNYRKRTLISKNITKIYNIKTNYTSFHLQLELKCIKINKKFKTLDEAIAYRDNYLKEHT